MMVNLYLLTMISFLKFTKATNPLSSNPAAVNGILVVCPEESFSITCSHTNTGAQQTRWTLSTSSSCTVIHDGSLPPVCTPFTVSMISNSSGSSLTSTIEATGSVVRGIPFITCQAGGLQSSTLVGNITLRVIDSPPVPEVGPIEYSVESATTGRAKFTVHSQGSLGSPVTYTGSVVGGSGSVEVTDNLITVTGLDYTQPHMVTVVAANNHSCSTVGTSNTTVLLLLNFAVSSLTASMMCSTSSLPIRVSWTVVSPGISSNSSVSQTPPPTATPTISYVSTGGRSGSTSSDSPYLLTDTVRNDTYTFTVIVSNVAGDYYFIASTNNLLADAFEVDQTSVASFNCLTVTISLDCIDDISSGIFSARLQYAFGVCGDLNVSDYRTTSVQLSNHSQCLPVGEGTGDFCYRATLRYQQDTVIDVETNLKFNSCSTVDLQSFLSNGVSYDLDGLESALSVPHLTTATLSCASTNVNLQGLSNTSCFDGVWSPTELGSCPSISSIADSLIVVIILVVLLVVYLLGTVCGLVVGHHWQRCIEALTNRETWAIVVVVVFAITFGVGFGILLYYYYYQTSKRKRTDPDFKLTHTEKSKQIESSSLSPPGSLYADGAKGKKEKKKVIQHETAPSGVAYALIDKMKKKSSKEEQPDVVPGSTAKKKELSYAEIHINTTSPCPKPPDQDLSCVEYATVDQL